MVYKPHDCKLFRDRAELKTLAQDEKLFNMVLKYWVFFLKKLLALF